MINKNFARSGGFHLFRIIMNDYLCCKVFFLFHTDKICSLWLPDLYFIDAFPLFSVIFDKKNYFLCVVSKNKLFMMVFDFVDLQDYF